MCIGIKLLINCPIKNILWKYSANFCIIEREVIYINALENNHYVFEVSLIKEKIKAYDRYPFIIPAIAKMDNIELHPKVTFFVGENGTGKSTLLEAIAVTFGLNAEGGSKHFNFNTKVSHSELHENILLRKGIKRARDSYFLRAESFYNVATTIDDLDVNYGYNNKSLHAQSHGESFMSLFLHRFIGNGFYILDEPEAALSPLRQMAFLCRLHQLIEANSQFIIATHSPIILAYPNSVIYHFSEAGIKTIEYEETDHFIINKRFANNYKGVLRELMITNS